MRRVAPLTMTTLRTSCAAFLACAILGLAPVAGCAGDTEPEATDPLRLRAAEQGVAAHAPTQPQIRSEPVALSAHSARGNFQIRIRPEGGSIPLNEPFAVILDLFDLETGQRLMDYGAVTLDARMPAHGHGMLRDVALIPTGEGSLRAEGLLFHMVGHWEFHVDLTQGPRVERAQASFELTF